MPSKVPNILNKRALVLQSRCLSLWRKNQVYRSWSPNGVRQAQLARHQNPPISPSAWTHLRKKREPPSGVNNSDVTGLCRPIRELFLKSSELPPLRKSAATARL